MIRTCQACGQKNRIPAEHLADTGRCGKCRVPLEPIGEPIDADPEIFEDIRQNAKVPVLIDFWAAWCGPCRMAAPEVKKVAEEMRGKALVLKVDTDRYPELAAPYGVQGIPNFVVLMGGERVFQRPGLTRSAEMKRWLEQAAA